MFCHPEEYRLGIYPMAADAVVEIDNIRELAAMDESYRPDLEENHEETKKHGPH